MLLIDADIIAVRAAVVHEPGEDEPEWLVQQHMENACNHADDMVSALSDAFRTRDVILCWSDPSRRYFRHDIYPDYKPDRGEGPSLRKCVRSHLEEGWRSMGIPRMEGDDVMGILATEPGQRAKCVVASADKDMLTVPGITLCRSMALRAGDTPEVVETTHASASRFHMLQTLSGDKCDGIPGLRGYGEPKPGVRSKGLKLLEDPDGIGTDWDRVVAAYEEQGLTEDIAIRNARLLAIRTHYTKDSLWSPRARFT